MHKHLSSPHSHLLISSFHNERIHDSKLVWLVDALSYQILHKYKNMLAELSVSKNPYTNRLNVISFCWIAAKISDPDSLYMEKSKLNRPKEEKENAKSSIVCQLPDRLWKLADRWSQITWREWTSEPQMTTGKKIHCSCNWWMKR